MSKTVDERVVSMRFDNKQFESNVQTTLSTLDKLKQKLDMKGASKGLENVDAASKKVNMSGLSGAVENVHAKFSAMEVMAVTALANITNSAVNAGKRIVSALTIDPIKTGFSEYETQINAVQTILANTKSKGTTLDDVNGALDTLNKYADKTIYNFTEMTRNIGTFTAAGVDLDTSVTAIQGIANLAAVSGSNSQQASTAMYQLSQALSSGTVKLMDWNSVVNAGMGGQVFQDALKETARVNGIAIDDMIKKHGSFRETLSEGWLTSEVLTETLAKFTMTTEGLTEEQIAANREMLKAKGYTDAQIDSIFDLGNTATNAATKVKTFTQLWDTLKEAAQSGWTQSWEILVGDFEEAKSLFTSISDTIGAMIGESADARNKVLQGWKDLGGRTAVIDAVKNAFEGVMSLVKPISEAFREIFPPVTAKQLMNLSEGLKNLTEKFKIGSETADKLKRTFKGIFSIFSIGAQIVKALFRGFATLIGYISPVGGSFLDITATIGDFLVAINNALKSSDAFNKAIQGIGAFLRPVGNLVKAFVKAIADGFKALGDIDISGVEALTEKVQTRFKPLVLLAEGIKKVFMGIGFILQKISPIMFKLVKSIGAAFGGFAQKVATSLKNADYEGLFDLINGGLLAAIFLGVKKFVTKLSDIASDAKGFFEGMGEIKDAIVGTFGALQTQLKAGALLKIAAAIAILAAALIAITMVDSEKLTSSLTAIAALFVELFGSLTMFDKLAGGKSLGSLKRLSTALIGMSIAILILSSAMVKLADLEWDGIAKGLVGILGLATILVAATKVLSSGTGKIFKGAASLIVLSLAIKILASVCKTFAALSWNEIAKGLAGVGVLLAEVAIFTKVAKFNGKVMSTAMGVLILSSAIKVLASACKTFAAMSVGEIVKGLAGVGILLLEVALFTKLTQNAKHVISTSLGIVLLASAMKILASVMGDIAALSWEQIAKGLVTLGVSLGLIAATLRLMPKNTVGLSIGLIGVATALIILSSALTTMGGMTWVEIAKGLVALAGSLIIMAIAMNAVKSAIAGAAAMFIMATAIAILTPQLKSLGSMSFKELGMALLTLAGAFVVLGVAGLLLKPLIPTMLALAGTFALIGVATALIGAGILALSIGLSSIAVSGGAIATAIVAITAAVVASVLHIIDGLGDAILLLCDILIAALPAITEVLRALVVAIVEILIELVPLLVDGILLLVVKLMDALIKYTPILVEQVFDLLIAIINAIAKKLPGLIQACVNLLMALFQGVIDALSGVDTDVLIKGLMGIGILTALMAALAAVSSLIPSAMLGVLGLGAVMAELALVLAAVGLLAEIPGLMDFVESGGNLMQAIGTAIGQFIGGIVGGFAQGATSTLPQVGTNLSEFMKNIQPFIEGAKSFDASALDGVFALVGVILALTAANVIDGLTSWFTGGSSLTKFGEEIADFAPCLRQFADSVSGIDNSAVEASAKAAKALADMTSHIPNSGGVAAWFAGENSISKFSSEIVELGEGLKEFSTSVSGVNPENIIAASKAATALADMTTHIPNSGGVSAWFAGENSISKFGEEIVALGEGLKNFSESSAGINPDSIIAASKAATALADMTTHIPNSGGVAAWFAGDNSLSKFGEDIVVLGQGLKGFSDATVGIDPNTVIAAAKAATALADMTTHIPNEGGMVSWFTGDNSLSKFGSDIIALGEGLKGFSDVTTGVNPATIQASAEAAESLADLTTHIPNEGGMVSWFTGDNSLSKFGEDLISLGEGLKGFSDSTIGMHPDAIAAAATAAASLADITAHIPNEGGMVSWFTGDNSLSKFGEDLISLGHGLKGFSDATVGINPETITATATAAASLADITNHIPNEGGMKSWFTGDNSLSKFGSDLTGLGEGLKGFSDATIGINPDTVTAAAEAAASLADITNHIPNEGGMKSWFTGDASLAKFSNDIVKLGQGLKGFSDATTGVNPDTISAAAGAASSLAEMTSYIPVTDGMKAWFTGDVSISKFGEDIIEVGKGLKGFADATAGINPESVKAAAQAAASLASMTNHIPNTGGIKAWFTGDVSLADFGEELEDLGYGLADFAAAVEGISGTDTQAAVNVAYAVARMTEVQPENTDALGSWGHGLYRFGERVAEFFMYLSYVETDSVSHGWLIINMLKAITRNIDPIKLTNVCDALNKLKETFISLGALNKHYNLADTFTKNVETLANTGIDSFVKAFDGAETKIRATAMRLVNFFVEGALAKHLSLKYAGLSAAGQFLSGMQGQTKNASIACNTIIAACTSTFAINSRPFYDAGANVAKGFARGISEYTYLATAKAKEMAAAAASAAKKELDEHSPSKVFYGIGKFAGLGFVNALVSYASVAAKAGSKLAKASVDGLKNSIYDISDIIGSNLDTQPTIRPVLDLSDVRAGVNAIGGMLSGRRTLDVDTHNVGVVSASMAGYQNGNNTTELVTNIKALRKDIANMPRNNYNINGITYDDGSNISTAVEELIRAARIERRI